jgi:hypothetical protein
LGVGTCIRNLGIDGTEYQHKTATARHIILEKKASYGDRKFTTVIPGPKRPFRQGRALSVPRREGKEECLPALEQLSLSQDGAHAEENDISQMLWAAKGRTPHYVKSHPWGLTIPTWAGHQNHTSVHLVKEKKLYRYVNWTLSRYINWKANSFPWWIAGNPTHDIKFVKKLKTSTSSYLPNTGIVLTRNEKTNRALWEVGYMLENMFLQAKSLQIEYKSKVLEEAEIREIEKEQISEPVAILIL